MKDSTVFARLIEEYGNLEQDERGANKGKKENVSADGADQLDKKSNAVLMQEEERMTGAVTWATYGQYLRFAGTIIWAPIILSLLTLSQTAQGKQSCVCCINQYSCVFKVGGTLFLGFWTSGSIHGFTQGDYMGVYAALGVAQAIFGFLVSISLS
jgi:ATP-binding cassette subfamily C (CFTR/MRP) protein 1